jgi:RNA polymerase-associated protein RTF1
MDESDSDAGSPEPTAAATSEKEKNYIMSMREVERESILAERNQEIERQRQNRLLRQLVSRNEHEKKQAKKRSAKDADLDEAQRKTSRQRTKIGGSKVGEVSAGIESLKRARAEKSDRQRRLAEDRERNRDKQVSIIDDGPDGDDESDVDWGHDSRRRVSRSRTPEKKDVPLAELRDMERVRLSRSRFAQICFYPGFDKAIAGCFVRISVGPDPATGGNIYRMALIKSMASPPCF